MKINAITNIKLNPLKTVSRTNNNFNFKGLLFKNDTFERTIPKDIKHVSIKNIDGESVQVTIVSRSPDIFPDINSKQFVFCAGKNEIGYATVHKNPRYDGMYLSGIYTEEYDNKHYKGVGTELLKRVVEESRERGEEGKITCCAFHNKNAPFLFYYKNNFVISDNGDNFISNSYLYNAPLQYAAKHNINISDLLHEKQDMFYMELDKDGADALMLNKRLCEDRFCKDIAKTRMNNKSYSVQFIEAPKKNEFFIQILDNNKRKSRLQLIMLIEKYKDAEGKSHFTVKKIRNIAHENKDELYEYAFETLKDIEKQYL